MQFNSGKSTFINALVGQKVCPDGVLPTTDLVNVLRYGARPSESFVSERVKTTRLPNSWLRVTNIVDTPGTNAVLTQHQEITEQFVPKSDFVVFVTSVDRPFSESERQFLAQISEWRKKVLLVVNKADALKSDADKKRIRSFVSEHAKQVLKSDPPIFFVSSRAALEAKDGLASHPHTER